MSARDVRSLSTCILCERLGSYNPRLAGIDLLLTLRAGRGAARVGAHPRCLVRGYEAGRKAHPDIGFITRLGVDEMGKIRMGDLPREVFRRVMIALGAQAATAPKAVS